MVMLARTLEAPNQESPLSLTVLMMVGILTIAMGILTAKQLLLQAIP